MIHGFIFYELENKKNSGKKKSQNLLYDGLIFLRSFPSNQKKIIF